MKKNIVFFMLVAIIFTSIGVYAGTRISAADIDYNDTTVEAAINDLYSEAYKDISFGTALYSQNQGELLASRSTTLTLNKGEYIMAVIWNKGYGTTGTDQLVNDQTINITCTNNCIKQKLSSKSYRSTARNTAYSTYHLAGWVAINLYYVKVDSDISVITNQQTDTANAQIGQGVILHAVPIEY